MNTSPERNFDCLISGLGPACPECPPIKTLAGGETAECVRNIRCFKNRPTTLTAKNLPKTPLAHAGNGMFEEQTPRRY